MPQGDVTLKFSQDGGDQLLKTIQALLVSLGQVSAAGKESGQNFKNTTEHSKNLGHEIRGITHIFTGLAGSVAGNINPALGKMIDSVAIGAQSIRYFGLQVGAATAAVGVVTTAFNLYIERLKEAEEFQIKLNLAVKNMDLQGVAGQLSAIAEKQEAYAVQTKEANQQITGFWSALSVVVNFWRKEAGPSQEELSRRTGEAKKQFQSLFEVVERPKLEAQALTQLLNVTKSQATFNMSLARSAEDVAESQRMQADAAKGLIEQQKRLLDVEETQAVAKARARPGGAGEEEVKVLQATYAKRRQAIEASLRLELQQQDQASKEKMATLQREEMDKGLSIIKSAIDQRLALQENAKTRELAILEGSTWSEAGKIERRQSLEERAITNRRDLNISALNAEERELRAFAAKYPELKNVQDQVDRRIISLQGERVRAETEADNQIIQQRQQMIDKMKQLAQQEAGIGDQLTQKAIERLQKRGRTTISREDILNETAQLRQESLQTFAEFQAGGSTDIAKLQSALGVRGLFGQMTQMGTTAAAGLGQLVAQTGAALGGRQAPFAQGGGLEGVGDFNPMGESLSAYNARVDLARARENLTSLGPTAGLRPPDDPATGARLDQTMQLVDEKGGAVIQRLTERIPPIMEGWFQKFVDEFIRKLEFESARS
jgi:hypothetical protein